MSIQIRNIIVKRGGKKIINQLNIDIKDGETVALVAPNGMGKTTLFSAIALLLTSTHDKLSLNNYDYKSNQYKKAVFFLERSDQLFGKLTIIDHMEFVKSQWNSSVSIEGVISQLEIKKYAKIPVDKLSLGMKQQALLALYLVSDAQVLLLDEPFNGLDPGNILILNQVITSLIEQGKTILMSSHNISTIQDLCSRVLFLNGGKIVADSNDLEEIMSMYKEIYRGGI